MKPITNQFCLDLLSKIDIKRAKALVNVIMALSSESGTSSPTSLSLSPFWNYHYSILSKVHKDISQASNFDAQMLGLCAPYIPGSDTYVLQSDMTPLVKAYSPTLAGRGYIAVPNNPIRSNQPINIGYKYSYVNLSVASGWSLPLSVERAKLTGNDMELSASQLNTLLSSETLPLREAPLVINTADSSYGVPHYLCPTLGENPQLVQIVRLRGGLKVDTPYRGTSSRQIYGDIPYYLQEATQRRCFNPKTGEYFLKEQTPIFALDTAEQSSFEITTQKGRRCTVTLWRFNDLLIRGTRECPMHKYPFDLVVSQVTDTLTGELVFKNNCYMGAWGKQRKNLSARQIYEHYRQRYDIEPHYRFSKQDLLLDKYNSPDIDHLDAWTKVVALTYWFLFLASDQVGITVNDWEKYLPEVKRAQENVGRKSPAMTRRAMKKLLLSFDLTPFMPQKSKTGKTASSARRGRQKGQIQPERTRYPPKKKTKIKLKTEKVE